MILKYINITDDDDDEILLKRQEKRIWKNVTSNESIPEKEEDTCKIITLFIMKMLLNSCCY